MCGGSKGQSQNNQVQSYAPNPQATGAITGALQQAQTAASAPFQAPVAPVAGFSQDQQHAFNTVNQSQGMAQPYLNQANQYFNQSAQGPNVSQFFNPYAGAVTAQMNNIFGQQASQNTGQLTQAAGGVGADRIAVGQANLANQQGLAAGQTMAGLYAPSLSAAQQEQNIMQGAGYGTAALGPAAQNAALSGAQAQLGTGGLQQQLSQAQMNAPYQNELARLAYPFQTSQFLSGSVGALAPGLGGTTAGTANATPAAPSMWSQLLGAGTAAAGVYGGLNSGGSGGKGSAQTGASYGGYNASGGGTGGWGSMGGVQYPAVARGGAINGFDDGGAANPYSLPSGFNDKPINIGAESIVPNEKLTPMQPHIPQLNLNPPAAASGNSGGGSGGVDWGNVATTALKVGMMFAKRGGAVNPYFAGGGDTGVINSEDEPYRMPDAAAIDAWRRGVDTDRASGVSEQPTALPPAITTGMSNPPPGQPHQALPFAGPPAGGAASGAGAPPPPAASDDAGSANPYSPPGAARRDPGFTGSPWAALTAAGLGMMAGTSPYAGVNIGQGGMQGLKTLQEQRAESQKDETINQAARRLEMEAKHHEDQFTRSTPYQKWEMTKPVPAGQVFDPQTGLNRTQFMVQDKDGNWTPVQGAPVTDVDGKPVKGQAAVIGDAMISGEQPPTTAGLGKMTPQVRAYLASQKFDLAKAQIDWSRAQKQIQALNGPQMTRGYNLYLSVNSTIDEVKELSSKMQLGGIPFMNKLELAKYIQSQGNSDKGVLATQYMEAVNTLKEEFANLANGGYAPTEPAWKLADEQVNGNYGTKQIGGSLDELKRLIGYRMKFIADSPVGPGAANRYTGNPGATAAPAGGEPAGGGKPDYATRKQQLQQTGLSGNALFKKLDEEGY